MPPKIVVICGPTASGKTRLAVELAREKNGEVVSADSMQIYRRMDIGTAKPTREEMGGIPHHMIDVVEPGEDYSVARYVEEASACVEDILARGKLPIVAGGTGLYQDSLVAGRSFAAFTGGWRERLQARAQAEGTAPLLRELQQVDPQRAARLHERDEKRIIRALEIWHETGRTMTQHDEESRRLPPRYEAVTIGLNFAQRAHLWERIDRRVDQMMADGLAEEVAARLAEGLDRGCTAMQAIGYKELASALEGERPLEEAVQEVKLRSRQYAKRQLTWFRRNPAVQWLLWEKKPNFPKALQDSTAYLEKFSL
jgi:tRNA dimethylallyltransferase